MIPVVITTARLVLDQPTPSDCDLIVEYCQDPLFEKFLTTPWPYQRRNAETFVNDFVPHGWASDSEYSWAIRRAAGSEVMGVFSWRASGRDIGFWLGGVHRGNGYMAEAAVAVTDWLFGELGIESVVWESVVGNTASASTAMKGGFRYQGERPSLRVSRDGTHSPHWHAVLDRGDSRKPGGGWPR
jgi:RimJ/RimL family protein N-acetyltransferase